MLRSLLGVGVDIFFAFCRFCCRVHIHVNVHLLVHLLVHVHVHLRASHLNILRYSFGPWVFVRLRRGRGKLSSLYLMVHSRLRFFLPFFRFCRFFEIDTFCRSLADHLDWLRCRLRFLWRYRFLPENHCFLLWLGCFHLFTRIGHGFFHGRFDFRSFLVLRKTLWSADFRVRLRLVLWTSVNIWIAKGILAFLFFLPPLVFPLNLSQDLGLLRYLLIFRFCFDF